MTLYYVKERNRYRIDFNRIVDGKRIRHTKMLASGISLTEAKIIHDKTEADLFYRSSVIRHSDEWVNYVESLMLDKQSWIYRTERNCANRSNEKNFKNEATAQKLKDLLMRSKGRCEVTGIQFHIKDHVKGTGRSRPYYHSLDRIDSKKGYENGNMRIVCYAVNVAMLHWGDEIFSELATGFVINKYCAMGLVAHLKV